MLFNVSLIQTTNFIRYSAYTNGYTTNGANFKLDEQYNGGNGLEENPDENEYNLNGMSYEYGDPLSNGLIVSNQPRQKTTASVGVSTASIR